MGKSLTKENAVLLASLWYERGFSRDKACEIVKIPRGSATYLLQKFGLHQRKTIRHSYSEKQMESVVRHYEEGMTRKEACQKVGLSEGCFDAVKRKYNLKCRPAGFQPGNNVGRQFKLKPRTSRDCLYCGQEMLLAPYEVKNNKRFCSFSCRSLYFAKRGKDHPMWKGGISDKWSKLHNSKEYQDWRLTVYQRDRFSCFLCKQPQSRKNRLHAHHKYPKKDYPELILDIKNGLTLCKDCHVFGHSKNALQIHQSRHGGR